MKRRTFIGGILASVGAAFTVKSRANEFETPLAPKPEPKPALVRAGKDFAKSRTVVWCGGGNDIQCASNWTGGHVPNEGDTLVWNSSTG